MKSVRYKIREAKIMRIMRTIDAALKGMDKAGKDTLLHKINACIKRRAAELCSHGCADPCDCAKCCRLETTV